MYTLVLWVLAAGAGAVATNWRGWSFALGVFAVGVYWSSLDQLGCSGFWRASYVVAKGAGQAPEISWADIYRASISNDKCEPGDDFAFDIKQIDEEEIDNVTLRQYRTSRGDFWIPGEGRGTLAWLFWEVYKDQIYQGHTVQIDEGDTVIDCGAHVGVATRYALERGARRVVSIEPDPVNLLCLRRNLADEIAAGAVIVVEKGVWKEETEIPFMRNMHDSSQHIVPHQPVEDTAVFSIPVAPLDQIVSDLGLERVDFIKMDIEGSEREALQGGQETIERFRPEMAICTYHRHDDPAAVRAAIARTGVLYDIHARIPFVGHRQVQPKILFFRERQ